LRDQKGGRNITGKAHCEMQLPYSKKVSGAGENSVIGCDHVSDPNGCTVMRPDQNNMVVAHSAYKYLK
jgi:hypothetical protein